MDPAWWAKRARLGEVGRPSAFILRVVRIAIGPLVRLLHRPRMHGADLLPDGPFLLVANHSAIGLSEVMSFVERYVAQVGVDRRLTGMAHPFAFGVWPISLFMREIGAIPSTYEAAEAALGGGTSVLVFPGGDHEAARPIWEANRVQFNGRKGFLKIARRAGVPIVPLGFRGSVYTAPMILRSRLLSWLLIGPRLMGVNLFPISLLGALGVIALILFALPQIGPWWTALVAWLWLGSPFSLLPWIPASISMRFGAPLAHDELFCGEQDEAQLQRAYERVQAAVQELVDHR
jgi:1-acyl-sn-glycerol-3-phosphate acyltransferase